MLRIVLAFIILLGSVLLGTQLHTNPGYVLIGLSDWTIETTVWVAFFSLVIFFLLFHSFLVLCSTMSKTPSLLQKWHSQRLAQKAQAITRQGLIEYSEGYWQKAKTHLIQALPNTDTPLLNYLTAARAAQKMGDSKLRDHYLRQAQQSMPEAKVAVELTQAELQLANQQWEQALATLKHLQDLTPKHPYVLKLLMNLYEQIRDWPQLITLLPDLKKYQVIPISLFNNLEQKAYLQAIVEYKKLNQSAALIELFKHRPKTLYNNHDIIAEYILFLFQEKQYVEAEKLLRQHLRKDYNHKLIELYGLLPCSENQLLFAESLVKKNPHSAALFICLGRQAMSQHLWGKAKSYLERSLEFGESPAAYLELGILHEQLQDPMQSGDYYKKGLMLTIQHKEAITHVL